MQVKKIHLIAPSSETPDILQIVDEFKQLAAGYNIEVIYQDSLVRNFNHAWYAAPYQTRVNEFCAAMGSQDVQVIWAMRGGYGAAELLFDTQILRGKDLAQDKVLVGFSDITALHMLFNQHYNLPSIHGPVVSSSVAHPESFHQVMQILQGKEYNYKLSALNEHARSAKRLEGQLVGGNLSVLCSMLATPFELQAEDKILLLEDVNEAGYKVMRYCNQLHQAGVFKKAQGVILGEFTKSDEHLEFALQGIINGFLSDVPVYKIENVGHVQENAPIILGNNAVISNDHILTVQNNF